MKSEIQFLADTQHQHLYFNSHHYSLFQFVFVFAPLDFHKEEMTHLARRLKTKRIARIAALHIAIAYIAVPHTRQIQNKLNTNS